ncbi:hypothetical protein D7D52_32025 [Nocardia yunnanensis]|uniref:Uncharacterized protein n=1 Tax=Nocardia yunnanensis TaxID=2382165 RepID=A0A386ZJZ6_9NOCA|nr:hypothetical protein [Nocardia yunnanensis]AYF77680.1 hypothetical protein D7D52_32025 [Nocardia yunnanensis]
MQRYRAALDTVGGCAAAAVAGLALIVPVDAGCETRSSALQTSLLSITVPRATAAGAVVAVLAAVCVAIFGARAAWGTSAVAALVLATDHLMLTSTSVSLATANFVDSLAAGVLLGAAGAAALTSRPTAVGYLLGALTGIAVGDHLATGDFGRAPLERAFDNLPPPWLTIPTVCLLIICCLISDRRTEPHPTTLNLPFAPILAAAVVITAVTVVPERLASTTGSVVAIVACVLVILAATVFAALLLPGRDGVLTLLAVALAGAASAIAIAAQAHWKLGPMLLAIVVGLAAGLLRPAPLAAAAAIVAMSVFALLGPTTPQDDSWQTLIGSCAVAAVAGYSFGSVGTRAAASVVLPLGVLLLPSAVLTLEYHTCTKTLLHKHVVDDPGRNPAWTALALAAGCLLALLALRHWRPESRDTNA